MATRRGGAKGPVEKRFRSVTLSEAKSPVKPDYSSASGGLRMTDPGERRFSTDPKALSWAELKLGPYGTTARARLPAAD